MTYYRDEPHECGGTILAGDPVHASPRAPSYWYCDRCDAFRFADARSPDAPTDRVGSPLAIGDTVQVNRQDICGIILRLHATTAIIHDATLPPCDAELEFRLRDLRRVATAEECGAVADDPPDPDTDGPMVPTGGAP